MFPRSNQIPVAPPMAQVAILTGQHLRLVDRMRRLADEAETDPVLAAFAGRMRAELEAALK